LGKIFRNKQYVITKEVFYEMFNKRVGRLNPYVSTTKMNSFLNGVTKYKYSKAREWKGVEREYMSLLRILCRYYLTKIHILCVFNKLRMQNLSRKFHIQGIRKILEVITR
jgi:5'-3' exonuclease